MINSISLDTVTSPSTMNKHKHPIRFIPVFVSCVLSGTQEIPPFLGQVCHGIGTMGGAGRHKKTRHKRDEKHNPWWTKGWSSQNHWIIEASQILMVTSPYQPGFVSGIECKSLYEYFNTLVTSFARDTKTRNLWVFAGPSKIRNDFHPISPVLDHISQVSLEHVVMFLFFSRSCRYSSHFLGPIFPHLPWVFPWFPVFLHGFQPWKNHGRTVPNGPVPRHGVLLSDAGIAFTWGDNRYGQLGRAPVLKEENGRCLPRGHPWWLDDLVPPWLLKAPDMGLFWEMRTSINGEFTGFNGDLPSSKLRTLWKMAYL